VKKQIMLSLVAIIPAIGITGCQTDATEANANLSKAANTFEVGRRTVLYNGITGEYILSVKGFCDIEDAGKQVKLMCKTGDKKYKEHFLKLSDNVRYFSIKLYSSRNYCTRY